MPMNCESCHQRLATVHMTRVIVACGDVPETRQEMHFCEQCADDFNACTPGRNQMRGLISLSDFYRSKLYDLLETSYPAAFEVWDELAPEAQIERVNSIQTFLREQLKKDGIELNGDGPERAVGAR